LDWVTFEAKDSAEACRAREAELLARRIRQLLLPGAPPVVARDGSLRQVQGSDVALLMRRFSFVEGYRQALARHGVPHRIVRGRGFYGAQEVLDLASALSLISDPADSLSFGAVLRSPLVCLSDQSLMRLAVAADGKLSLRQLWSSEAIASSSIPADERLRLERFLGLYRRLRAERDRLGVQILVRFLLDETEYRLAIAGAPFGEQALANLDKLVELATRWDEGGQGGSAAFARELVAMADEDPREAQADVLDDTDARAVQILTVHQAKGLEWPIVCIPDLAAQRVRPSSAIAFDRREGLAIKLSVGGDPDRVRPPRHSRVIAELGRREDAEYLRLLYVALTRARDRLVLSGQTSRSAGTWRSLLADLFASAPALQRLLNPLEAGDLPLQKPAWPKEPEPTKESENRVEEVSHRVRSRVPPSASEVVLPVTQMQDYLRCPRRYLYAHRVGLSEFPIGLELEADRGLASTREQGTLAHRLLELVDLTALDRGGEPLQAQLKEILWMQGIDPSAASARQILSWMEAFSKTSFVHRLSKAGPARVHRELPFLLRLDGDLGGPTVYLKGQIDLLFEDEEGRAVVIDYKASARPPAGLAPYVFQLDCYRLAAQQFVRPGVSVIAGLVFLQQKSPEPDFWPDPEALQSGFAQKLRAAAAEMSQVSSRSHWPGREQLECASSRCGYQYRCHPHQVGL
jgi:ATP-dependent exoDNAse (exonuclease V) beta subunit